MQIAIVDYGRGNLHSVHSGLEKAVELSGVDAKVVLTSDPEVIAAADKVVFPGVGAMGDCYQQLLNSNLDAAVREAFKSKPFLGVCVGMQVLFETGEENGGSDGLGFVKGKVVKFAAEQGLKVPHMGWNEVFHNDHPLFEGIPQAARFYFVHSYKVQPADIAVQQAHCEYGGQFTAAVGADNWFATQFHPEKSHQWGLKLLSNFVKWNPAKS